MQPQTQRSQLTRPQPSWGMIKQREGLSARPLTNEETTGKMNRGPAGPGKWWTVEYSKRYKGVTKTFMQAVMTGGRCIYMRCSRLVFTTMAGLDPETLWRVLQTTPWHADTLLQLAEVYRHREGPSNRYLCVYSYSYIRFFRVQSSGGLRLTSPLCL